MNSNELRIGNLVMLKDKGIYRIANGHDIEKIEDWDDTDYCTGVPITKEILLQLGFTKCSCNGYKVDSVFKFHLYDDFQHKHANIYLKYVHQVQNLFFGLTGHELS